MLNSDLPNINGIGNGSEVRAKVALLIGYAETHCGADDKTKLLSFFMAAATRLGYTAPEPDPDPVPGGE